MGHWAIINVYTADTSKVFQFQCSVPTPGSLDRVNRLVQQGGPLSKIVFTVTLFAVEGTRGSARPSGSGGCETRWFSWFCGELGDPRNLAHRVPERLSGYCMPLNRHIAKIIEKSCKKREKWMSWRMLHRERRQYTHICYPCLRRVQSKEINGNLFFILLYIMGIVSNKVNKRIVVDNQYPHGRNTGLFCACFIGLHMYGGIL